MPSEIDLAHAKSLLIPRVRLLDAGRTEREIGALVESGELLRVRRGQYVAASTWDGLWNEGRHLLEVLAAHRNAEDPVFWGPSAAVLHGLPLYRTAPGHVHTVIADARHSRSRADVMMHNVAIAPAEIVRVDGIRCTSLDRTVLDLARSLRPDAAVSAADAALRREAVDHHVQDQERADAWRGRLLARAAAEHGRGIRRARWVLAFADGRAQLPGESVSRLLLHDLGYGAVPLQVHVRGETGKDYWMDFGFPRSAAFGEFDGLGKYHDPALRGERTTAQALLAEKQREDDVRGVTGWRVVRWGFEHIRTPELLGARLRAFGVRPPA